MKLKRCYVKIKMRDSLCRILKNIRGLIWILIIVGIIFVWFLGLLLGLNEKILNLCENYEGCSKNKIKKMLLIIKIMKIRNFIIWLLKILEVKRELVICVVKSLLILLMKRKILLEKIKIVLIIIIKVWKLIWIIKKILILIIKK